MDSYVVAINVCRRLFLDRGVQAKFDAPLQFLLKVSWCPAMPQEQELQACALTVLAQLVGLAEDFGDALDHRQDLVPAHEGVQPRGQVRLGRKSAAYPQREAGFGDPVGAAIDGG